MSRRVPVERWSPAGPQAGDDFLAEEAPLEILIEHSFKEQRRTSSWGITLRTPGHDAELALGLLFSEGRIDSPADIDAIEPLSPNAIRVSLHPSVDLDLGRPRAATAACGFCGSPDLPIAVPLEDRGFRIPFHTLAALPAAIEQSQPQFHQTGAVHAAALFNAAGDLIAIREDIGRHNAVDKLIGWALRENPATLEHSALLLSGRAGFELVHKAARARIPLIAAIGAPTTLSVDLARHTNLTLAGFLRQTKVNIYTGTWRIQPA